VYGQSNSFDKKMVEIAGIFWIFLNLNWSRYARDSKYMVGMYSMHGGEGRNWHWGGGGGMGVNVPDEII
jgi:hypothetical protein